MGKEALILAAASAYFSGRGYYVNTNFKVPGKNIVLDMAAVMPRMRELKIRLQRGFAPTGILNHLIGGDWVLVKDVVAKTGYDLDFVGKVLEDAAQDNWVELGFDGKKPRCRIKDYRVPARECNIAFLGTTGLEDKLHWLGDFEGCYTSAYFIFPYNLDDKTVDLIASAGGGIIKYHQAQGIFQKLVPAETIKIEDQSCFAKLVEKVLYDNIWVMTEEII